MKFNLMQMLCNFICAKGLLQVTGTSFILVFIFEICREYPYIFDYFTIIPHYQARPKSS